MNSTECTFFEYRLANSDPEDIVQRALDSDNASMINTINAHAYNVALEDEEFHKALVESDYLVADGIGVVWAGRLLGARGLRKIAGHDLFLAAMKLANEQSLVVGFLGSTPEVLSKISSRSAVDYPNAEVRVLSPPFAPAFEKADAISLANELGEVDILFIGMTAPKQEKFANLIKYDVNARAVLSIGAVFDFYAGSTSRPHPIFIKLGLEWLGRSIAEPRRLGKRSLVAIPTFIYNCVSRSLFDRGR
jgi:N-acetylglucosaminyldiphosphoundecaprenol N-acetyl-beta-D-mannosaminyltransferase